MYIIIYIYIQTDCWQLSGFALTQLPLCNSDRNMFLLASPVVAVTFRCSGWPVLDASRGPRVLVQSAGVPFCLEAVVVILVQPYVE